MVYNDMIQKYLKVLGFNEIPSSFEEIKKSYKTLVKKYHPDLNPYNKQECEKKIKEINEAYEFLSKKLEKADFSKLRDLYEVIDFSGKGLTPYWNSKNSSHSDDIKRKKRNSEFMSFNDIIFPFLEEKLIFQLNKIFQNFKSYQYTETNRVNLRLNIPLKNIFNQKEIIVKYKFKDNQYKTKLKLSKLNHLQDQIKFRNKDHELNIFLNIDDTPYTRIKSDLYLTIKRKNIENNKVKVFHDLEEKHLLIEIPDTNVNILRLKGKGMWKDDLHRGDLYLIIE